MTLSFKETEIRLLTNLNLLHLSSTRVVMVQVVILAVTRVAILAVTRVVIPAATQVVIPAVTQHLLPAVFTFQNTSKVAVSIKV